MFNDSTSYRVLRYFSNNNFSITEMNYSIITVLNSHKVPHVSFYASLS